MTSHTGRLYAVAIAVLVFFLTWAAIASRPFARPSTSSDPRLAALVAREQQLRVESLRVRRLVRDRWAVYRVELRKRNAQIAAAQRLQAAGAAAPSVRVVTLPPLTVTRSS